MAILDCDFLYFFCTNIGSICISYTLVQDSKVLYFGFIDFKPLLVDFLIGYISLLFFFIFFYKFCVRKYGFVSGFKSCSCGYFFDQSYLKFVKIFILFLVFCYFHFFSYFWYNKSADKFCTFVLKTS